MTPVSPVNNTFTLADRPGFDMSAANASPPGHYN